MDVFETIGSLPKKITDVTDAIAKGMEALNKMVNNLGAAVNSVNTLNPVSKSFFDGLSKVAEAGGNFVQSLDSLSDTVGRIKDAAKALDHGKDVMTASRLVVDAVFDSVTGHFHADVNQQVFSDFDQKWDVWAKTVNEIYGQFKPADQNNVLENLAKNMFGENVFYFGSAIKNESAGIFGGIADFENALHAFRGNYRDISVAVQKIEKGVKGIIAATEKTAGSINNMLKTIHSKNGKPGEGNPILSYIENLHDRKAVAIMDKVLSAGGGAATLWSDGVGIQLALKSKDPKAVFSAGKKTFDDVKKIIKGLKAEDKTKGSEKGKKDSSATEPPKDSSADQSEEQKQDDWDTTLQQVPRTDSYVCSKARMKCTYGDRMSTLTVFPERTIWLTGEPQANISDHVALKNIEPFGNCHTTSYPLTGAATAANHGRLTPRPCVPNTPFPWTGGKNDVLLKGQPALLKSSTCKCVWGGTITLVQDGQKEGTYTNLEKERASSLDELNAGMVKRNSKDKGKL